MMDRKMLEALAADGEKLRQLTGRDHGPFICMECEEPRPLYRSGMCRGCYVALTEGER